MSPPNQEHICSLFLKDCGVPGDQRVKFLAWINEMSSYKDLNFENLLETLKTFYKEIKRKDEKKPSQNEQEELLPDNEISILKNKSKYDLVSLRALMTGVLRLLSLSYLSTA
jgi:DNA helicase B